MERQPDPVLDDFAAFMDRILDTVEKATQVDRATVFREILQRMSERDICDIPEVVQQLVQELLDENKEPNT